MASENTDVARILVERAPVDANAADRLIPLVYDELRALARHYLRGDRVGQFLQPTALVHEAYLRTVGIQRISWKGKTHFLAVAAMQMRRILVDHARLAAAAKRGGRATRITLEEDLVRTPGLSIDVLALDEALSRLGQRHPRQASVAELRLFSGMRVGETALHLGVSERTVKGDWRFARAWLVNELGIA